MSACIEFIDRIGASPYHPVVAEDYPRLFDLEITPDGVVYLERLRAEWLSGAPLQGGRLAHLHALHLAYAAALKSPDEIRRWQAFVFLGGGEGGGGRGLQAADDASCGSEARGDLVRMGCLRDNEDYDPRLYKSHVLWRERKLSEIEAFLGSL